MKGNKIPPVYFWITAVVLIGVVILGALILMRKDNQGVEPVIVPTPTPSVSTYPCRDMRGVAIPCPKE